MPGICEYVSYMAKGLNIAAEIKVANQQILKQRDYHRLVGWAQCNYKWKKQAERQETYCKKDQISHG